MAPHAHEAAGKNAELWRRIDITTLIAQGLRSTGSLAQ